MAEFLRGCHFSKANKENLDLDTDYSIRFVVVLLPPPNWSLMRLWNTKPIAWSGGVDDLAGLGYGDGR